MHKHILTILSIAIISISAYGQNILNSPYSRIGLGDIENQSYMAIRQMGSPGSSWINPALINNTNPASLPFLRSTAFDIGLSAKKVTLDDANAASDQWGGQLEYMGLAFPLQNPINEVYEGIKKEWRLAMAFNVSRRSTIGYNITSKDSTEEIGVFTRNYRGRGGAYEFNWSNGIQYKDFSFGVSLGYLFGNSSYAREVAFDDKAFAFNDNFNDAYFTRAFTYNLGAIYSTTFGKGDDPSKHTNRLTLGLRANNGTTFTVIGDKVAFGTQRLGDGSTIVDTINYNVDIRGKGYLPGTFGFGANFQHGNDYGLALELNTSPWSNYYHELKDEVKNELRNEFFVSLGGFYRPDYKSYNNFFKRMSYRLGGFYREDPRIIDESAINHYALTGGVEFPFVFQRKSSTAQLGFELGSRGKGTVIGENYLQLTFGFTFNDEEWFIKRKYN